MQIRFFGILSLLLGIALAGGARADSEPPQVTSQQIEFRRAAVAPFLVGRREPQMDEKMDRTVSCTIGRICLPDATIASNAGGNLTRLTYRYLYRRFGNQMVPPSEVAAAFDRLTLDDSLDTPRTLALKLSGMLNADAVFVGTVWRYRDRGVIKQMADSPASVAFAVYLIDARTGHQLWRGLYQVTQRPVSNDLFQAKKLFKLGLKWRSADEIASHGVDEVFREFMPDTGTSNGES